MTTVYAAHYSYNDPVLFTTREAAQEYIDKADRRDHLKDDVHEMTIYQTSEDALRVSRYLEQEKDWTIGERTRDIPARLVSWFK